MTKQERKELVHFWLGVQASLLGTLKGGLAKCIKSFGKEDTPELRRMSLTAVSMFLGEVCVGLEKDEPEAKKLLHRVTASAGVAIHKIYNYAEDAEDAEPGEEGGAS